MEQLRDVVGKRYLLNYNQSFATQRESPLFCFEQDVRRDI